MIPQHREEPLYQRELFRLASADCLRPGGVELTERGLAHCAFGGGERVADLGCGPGVTLALLAERGLSPVGMDRSAAMLQEAERRLSGVPLLAGTLEGLPFRDACMDGIVCECVLSLSYTPERALGEMGRVLRPGGRLLLTDIVVREGSHGAGAKRFSVEDMEELYAGIRLACEEYGVDIVGGDTSSSYTGLTISITCIGEGEKGKVVYRNGAKETDLICVSGDLGAAYMGLQLLEREKSVLKGGDKDLQPDFAGKEYLLERQLKPEARRDIIQKLAKEGIQPTSMMDVSDGLSSELLHICTQSKVGCRIYEEHIPIDYQTAVMAEEFNMNLTTCALNGGEDYELLFTVPIADHEKVSEMEGIKLIGHITKPELGCALISRDGQEFELKAQGWNPLKEESAAQQEEVE